MRFFLSKACKAALILSFFFSGLLLYEIFGYALVTLVSITHAYDLPHAIENRVWLVSWLLYTIPAAWLAALALTVVEACRKARIKRLTVYALSPFAGTVVVLGLAWLVVWFVMSPRSAPALLRPHLVRDAHPIWLFEPSHGRIDFNSSSPEALAITEWVAAHQTGWAFSSVLWKPSEPQISGGTFSIELTGQSILLDYYEHENDVDDDPDSDIHLERNLSADEQAFWIALLARIKAADATPKLPAMPNNTTQPTAFGG